MITLYSFNSAFGHYTDSSSTAQLTHELIPSNPIQNHPLPEDTSADLIHP